MANKLLTPREAARSILKVIDDGAKNLTPAERVLYYYLVIGDLTKMGER